MWQSIVPVLKEFLAQNPDTEIVFVSRKNFSDLFDGVERLTFRGVNLDDYKGFRTQKIGFEN